MNNHSLLLGFFDWVISLLDNIPRVVYFFFAAFTSGIDALQCMIRKLAGLDIYWTKSVSSDANGTVVDKAVFGQDPLTEFIYGILGIGDSSVAYKALNTVFISLSIFALIVLAVTTMVAIIKSHYSEEYQNTNPWKYIYTAIKSVLTYAILPVVVVIGLQLSGLILRTLDNITSGTSAEKIVGIYGNNVVQNHFVSQEIPGSGGKKSYTRYDFFGAGTPTTSQTFGGMLFNAASYSSNRTRNFEITLQQAQATEIFGQSCPEFDKLSSTEERQEYVAYQVDFAFSNNIGLKSRLKISDLQDTFEDVRYYKSTDFLGGFGVTGFISSFSKYNVPLVWMFYDLWKFQFIVAFGGGASVLGLMLSIIIGLMSRLIKGAVLFLLYPPVLSIAPLDSFKAFKSWGGEFMKQILMAYGMVVGFNLLMIVLPLVQNISWFGPGMGVIDALINMIILIVGLLMTKDIIALASGFVGGADAASEGDKYKAQVASTVKTGFGTAATIGAGAIRAGMVPGRLAGVGVKSISRKVTEHRDKKALDAFEGADGKLDSSKLDKNFKDAHVLDNEIDKIAQAGINNNFTSLQGDNNLSKDQKENIARVARQTNKDAKAAGKSKEERESMVRAAVENELKTTKGADGKSVYKNLSQQQKDNVDAYKKNSRDGGLFMSKEDKRIDKEYKQYKRAEKARAKTIVGKDGKTELKYVKEKGTTKYSKTNYSDEEKALHAKNKSLEFRGRLNATGAFIKNGTMKGLDKFFDAKAAGKSMGDAFLKTTMKMGQTAGIDKMISGMKDIFKDSMTMTTKKFTGDNLAKENAAQAKASANKQAEISSQTNKLLEKLIKSNDEVKRANNASFTNLANIMKENKPKDNNDSKSKK